MLQQSTIFHIPAQFVEFPYPVLILCMNHRSAKVYQAYQRDIIEKPDIHTVDTDYHYSDNREGMTFSSATSGGTRIGADHHNKEHYEKVFLNYFITKLQELEAQDRYHRIFIFTPPDIKNMVKEKLPKPLLSKIEIIEGNFAKAHLTEVLKKLTLT